MSFDQFEEDVEPFLGRQVGIELVVSLFGVFKTAEYLSHSFHEGHSTMRREPPYLHA